jgi:hypothetical protein
MNLVQLGAEKRKSMEFAEFRPIESDKKLVPPSRVSSISSNPLVNLLNSLGGVNSIGFDKYLPAEIPLQTTKFPEQQLEDKKKKALSWIFKMVSKKEDEVESKSSKRAEKKVERLGPFMEKYTYQISHMKLCEPDRPFGQRLVVTNLMLYVIAVQAEMNIRGLGPAPVKRVQKPKEGKDQIKFSV